MPNFKKFRSSYENIIRSNRILLGIIIIAFILRVSAMLVLNIGENEANCWIATKNIVQNLIDGKGYTWDGQNPDFFMFPGYMFFLAFIRLLGLPFIVAKLLQCLMDSLMCLVIYHIGKRAFNSKTGLLGAFIWSIFPFPVIHAHVLDDSTMIAFFSVLSILLSIILLEKKQFKTAILLGLSSGIAILTRSTFLSFLIILFPLLIIQLKLRNIKYILVVALTTFTIVCPWVIRNYIHTGYITLGTHGGLGLWAGNNPYINSLLKANLNQDYLQKKADYFNPGCNLMNVTPEQDKIYFDRAFEFIKSNPSKVAENILLRLGYFYGWKYYFRQASINTVVDLSPSNIEELKAEVEIVYSQPLVRLKSLVYSMTSFPLFLMALAGLIICRPLLTKEKQIILLFIVFFTAVHVLSIANARHRIPIDALMTLYASGFILWLIEKLKIRFGKKQII